MDLSYKNNAEEILEELLKHHDIKTLRGILNSKVRKKEPRGNNYFTIAVDVYIQQYESDSKLEWAIEQVAMNNNLSDKTVKNHITKFRKEMKKEIEKFPAHYNYSPKEVSSFIGGYISKIYKYFSDGYNYHETDKKYIQYTNGFTDYLHDIHRISPPI